MYCSNAQTTRKSIDPPSNRRHSPDHILDDDILLNIFYLYQLELRNEEKYYEDGLIGRWWDLDRW
jgi:hypothetical protein